MGCSSIISGDNKCAYVSFSGDDNLQEKWITQIEYGNDQTESKDSINKYFRICTKHFRTCDLNLRGQQITRKKGTYPQIFPKSK